MMGRLDGKVALITGGARGMGKPHARHFVARSLSIARIARPAEVSPLLVFPASGESSCCTGSELVVDGGMLSGPGCSGAAA